METEKKIEMARMTAIRKVPILAPLVAKIRIARDDSVITAGLIYHKKLLVYNKEFIERLDNETLIAVLLHEFFHYLFIHDMTKLRDRKDKILLNIVTDAIINYLVYKILGNYNWIRKIGGITFNHIREFSDELKNLSDEELIKEDHLYLASKIKQKLEEFVNDLVNSLKNGSEGNQDKKIEEVIEKHFGDRSEDFKEGLKKAIKEALQMEKEMEEIGSEELKKLQEEVRKDLERGKVFAKQRGTEFAGLLEILDIILKRKRKDWRKVLREMVSEIKAIATDYDFTRPSVKTRIFEEMTGRKTFIPSLEKEDIELNVIIGIDVSGSISDEEYKEFINEIYNLMEDIKEVRGWIVMWEADVTKVIRIKNGWNKEIFEELKRRKGYGGTVIESFFRKADELVKRKRRNTYLVILTDGYTENVRREWVRDWKRVIFILTKNGTKEQLREVIGMKNVAITFIS